MNHCFNTRGLLPIGIVLFLFFPSCGVMKGGKGEQTVRQIEKSLEAGDFQKAIDLCDEVYHRRPKEADWQKRYMSTLEYIRDYGDNAFKKDDFPAARDAYDLLLKNVAQAKPFAHLLSFNQTYLETRARLSRTLPVEKQAQSSLLAGNFQKAIDVYREHHRQQPRDLSLQGSYIRTLETIKESGDRAFEKNDFFSAGGAYQLLLKNFPSFKNINRPLSFTREGLSNRIEACTKNLFESALVEYRSGNLERAISLWKRILIFDPGNPETRKAVETATVQSRTLEMKK